MASVLIPANSLIIPMDTTYQDLGMFKAYGLVYRLLSNGIPVMWAIRPGKPYDGTDFTASAVDFQTNTPVVNHAYSGGPFIIDAAFAAAAAPIVTAWQGSNTTTVHRVTGPFTADVWAAPFRPPRIAVEQTNASIVLAYLNAAGIPDSTGNPWTSASPDILDPTQIANGALLENPSGLCKRNKYDIFISPHTSDSTWTNPGAIAALDKFVQTGGFVHSMCHSISAIENVFFFLTTTGIPTFGNKGVTGTFTVDIPDYGVTQAVSTNNPQPLPGGSEQTWEHNQPGLTYRPGTRVMAHFLDNNGVQYDFMVSGVYKGGTGAGVVTYEGGHSYSVSLPYSNNVEAPYVRFVLDDVIMSVSLPHIVVDITPNPTSAGVPTTFTATVSNNGGMPAQNLNFSLTPAAGVSFVASSIPPTTSGPPTWTWTGLTLNPQPTQVPPFTITLSGTPVVGENSLLNFTATYADGVGDSFTKTNCASVQATAGPVLSVTKTPSVQSAFPNQAVSWTVSAANNGPVGNPQANLTNPVLTDVLPAGLIFVSAVPAPTTNTLNPDGTRTLTWAIPSPMVGGATFGPVTINVITPPATSQTFTNTATLSGTDVNGAPVSASATAQLEETDRPPVVDITTPLPPGPLSGTVNVCWTASDPDGDPLTFDVFYSPDCSSTLIPINTGVTGNCTPWNTSLLNGDNFCITVVASDGLLTGQDTEGPYVIDNAPPTVEIISPTPGSTICGSVQLCANAADDIGVARVSFAYSLNGGTTFTDIGSALAAPYCVTFESTSVPDGPILIQVTATDTVGNTATAQASYIVDNTPPTAAITAPPNGSEVSGTVTVVGSASDNIALNRVEWMIDGTLMAIQTVPPFDFVWDTTQFTEGPHTFTLTAIDNCGNTAVATATFIVNNVPDHVAEVGVNSNLIIPPQKPPAEMLLEEAVDVQITKVMVIRTPIGGKVIVFGVVHVRVTYVADVPDQSVHVVEADFPFRTFILWPELLPDTPVDVTTFIESADFKLLDPRTIGKFIVILVGVTQAT
jgi:uncharacterized repeat protein (TIGR01451 family)